MAARHTLSTALLLVLGACTRVGAPPAAPAPAGPAAEPAAESMQRSLAGVVTLGGQRMRVELRTDTDSRGRGTAHLEIPGLSLAADGTARWGDDGLELDLRYGGACPGTLRVRTRAADAEARLEGTLTANDCTGEASGELVLEPRAGPPTRAPTRGRVESAPGGV